MKDYAELYQRNKKLDDIFYSKYSNDDNKLYEKNCLELVVELCELANESKCFKYWSIKKPNKEALLEEYADSLLMVLYMFNEYNIDDIEIIDMDLNSDILFAFNELIRMCTLLINRVNVSVLLVKEIFTYLLHVGKLLDLSDKEILNACYKKIVKNEERLNSNY